jgi:hypothetical protein
MIAEKVDRYLILEREIVKKVTNQRQGVDYERLEACAKSVWGCKERATAASTCINRKR